MFIFIFIDKIQSPEGQSVPVSYFCLSVLRNTVKKFSVVFNLVDMILLFNLVSSYSPLFCCFYTNSFIHIT